MIVTDTGRHLSLRPSPAARTPRLYGICAAMMPACAFAANNASAQTECPEGETRLSKTFGFGVSDTGCVADDAAEIMRDCEDKGWAGLEPTLAPLPARQVPKTLAKRFALTAEQPPTAHKLP